jgi:hypothetical protein
MMLIGDDPRYQNQLAWFQYIHEIDMVVVAVLVSFKSNAIFATHGLQADDTREDSLPG